MKPKRQPGWFQASEKELSPLTEARNEAMPNVLRKRTRLNTKSTTSSQKQQDTTLVS